MAKSYVNLDTRIDSFTSEFNSLVNKVGDIALMSTSGTDSDVVGGINNLDSDLGTRTSLTTTADQNLVVAINEIDAELGTITAGAMGTTASTVSAAIAELDTEADSDRTNLGTNVKAHMLANGVSAQVTATANNSTDETVYLTFVDGATGAQGIETDTGLSYNPSSGLITAGSVSAATMNVSGTLTAAAITLGDAVLSEAEFEILDGANITTAELNIMDGTDAGDASSAAITILDSDAFVMNDGGTMRQVDASLLKSYFGQAAEGTALSTIDINGAATITSLQDADEIPIHDNSADSNRNTAMSTVKSYVLGGKVTDAAQTNITSLGTLTALTVDNLGVNGNTITANSGALNLTPASGSAIVLDGTINVDAGVVTGATSVTSTAFVGGLTGNVSGDLTGDVTGTADVATLATNVTISANNTANETVYLTHVDGATGTQGLETDTTLTYNPSTGVITTTGFAGALTGNADTATALATGRTIGMTGDVVWTSASFTGAGNVTGTATIQASAVETSMIAADNITGALIADNTIDTEHYADASLEFAHMQNVAANSILGRNANSSGVLSEIALATTQILIGDGTGFTAAALSGDVTMANTGAVTIANDAVSGAEMKTLRTFTLKDSAGTTLFTMYGAGAAT